MNKKEEEFNKILLDIKSIKIQGAKNVARAALRSYVLIPTKNSKETLLNSRPTEPMMHYVLDLAEEKTPISKILNHFSEAQTRINNSVLKLIKNKDVIFTHCHSTNVINSLIYAKKRKKQFEVYSTETRPLSQGRKTATELMKAGIKVTMFIDSAGAVAIERENKKDKIYSNKIFIGADALLKDGIINKIGSGMFAEIAHKNNIPVYVIADSWKFTKNRIPIEQRSMNEVWDKAPKNIKIKNPAFEFVNKKYISGIVTELGLMKYDKFVKRMG